MPHSKERKYTLSEKLLARASRVIPGGVQTLAKGTAQYPLGVSPFYVAQAQGAKIWDVDGNAYTDFVSALMAIILGYADPDVQLAINKQLAVGSIFSLNHELEVLLAEKLCTLIPSAEMVRFGKNGSDCTTVAIRLARGYTQRDKILVCGYHSWHDWYIGISSKSYGVPDAFKAFTHPFQFNDEAGYLELFEKHREQLAAVIIEPIKLLPPAPGFLATIRQTTQENGSLLIFDETITAFRYALGSVQGLVGVQPDLVVLGKGLSNGLPLSALAGPTAIMKHMEELFFSFTYAGETLSMAAALATIQKIEEQAVLPHLETIGSYLNQKLQQLISDQGLEEDFQLRGYPVRSHFKMNPGGKISLAEKNHLFSEVMFSNGVINNTIHTINYAHTLADVDQLLLAYQDFFDRYLQRRSLN